MMINHIFAGTAMTTLKKWIGILIFAGLFAGILSACSPDYRTHYTFTPPTTEKVASCVASCKQKQQLCNDNCINRFSGCVDQQDPFTRDTKAVADYSDCHDACGCNALYAECYQGCGGKVTWKKECVSYCQPR